MPDGYDRDRDGFDSNQRGRIFENGSYQHFRDRENGYVQESEKYRALGVKIKFDKLSKAVDQVRSIEEKSGQLKGPKDEKQLEVVYELIRTGKIDHHTLRTVERELISERCQELIDKIRRDFPDKFTHHEISRTDAREIWAKGLAIERGLGQQLELDKVREKAREGKAQALQNRREKIAEIANARDRKERARERLVNILRIVKAREEDRARLAGEQAAKRVALESPAPEHLRRIEAPTADRTNVRETPDTERNRAERAAEEKAVREFQDRLSGEPGSSANKATAKTTIPERESPEAARARVEQEAREQVLREFPFPVPQQSPRRETVEIGERSTPELADAARAAREAAGKAEAAEREAEAREATARSQAELDQARDAAYREMLNQAQVPEHVRLGLSHAQAPEAAVRTPPGQAPSVERGGRGGPDARGIERTR